MNRFPRILLSAALLAFLAPPGAGSAQSAKPAGSASLTVGGFISGTLYVQNQLFGLFTEGQAANAAPPTELENDTWFHGADVRNTRVFLAFTRPEEDGWSTAAHLELDLFGGWNGSEPFGDEMPMLRLRLAYADLTNGETTVRIGQGWAPIFGNVPASLSHIAFPLGYGSGGVIGWRFPGVFIYHDLDGDEGAMQLQVAAMAGSWSHVMPGAAPDDPSPGEAGLFPQIEARLNLGGELGIGPWDAYVVGHVDRKDMDGVGVDGDNGLTGTAVEAGARIRPGPWTFHGNAYYGRAVGQLLASITQLGDYVGQGGWLQAGYRFDPRFSVWGFVGVDDAEDGDAALPTGARDLNRILAAMLRYDRPGYALGLEWLHANTEFVGAAESSSASQLALSVFYAF